ncbi:uncharacterized protein LOC126427944 [Schistocerca serialis cubense]|uniref:uncharacterized protein LOC126427944 n=1 Tax=Schistocerca serialis cubense TaxID=2023355 RepID=UPI00214EF8AE|nr:uncharacterized protein LOC126427944 [Schistocerca serialis cubense]
MGASFRGRSLPARARPPPPQPPPPETTPFFSRPRHSSPAPDNGGDLRTQRCAPGRKRAPPGEYIAAGTASGESGATAACQLSRAADRTLCAVHRNADTAEVNGSARETSFRRQLCISRWQRLRPRLLATSPPQTPPPPPPPPPPLPPPPLILPQGDTVGAATRTIPRSIVVRRYGDKQKPRTRLFGRARDGRRQGGRGS